MDGHVAFYSFYSINYNMNIKIVFSLPSFTTTPLNLFIHVHVDGYRKWVREEKTKKLVKKFSVQKKTTLLFKICKKSRTLYRYPIIRLKTSIKMQRDETKLSKTKKKRRKKKTQNFPEHNQRTNFFVLILLCVIARPTILSNPKAL